MGVTNLSFEGYGLGIGLGIAWGSQTYPLKVMGPLGGARGRVRDRCFEGYRLDARSGQVALMSLLPMMLYYSRSTLSRILTMNP